MKTLKSESSILGPLCNQSKVWPAQGFLEPSLYSSYHVHVTLLVNPPTHLLLSHSCRTCTQRQSSAHCAARCTEVDYRFNYWWRGCLCNLQSFLHMLCRWFWMRMECRRATVSCTLRPRSLQTWPSRRSTACCWTRRKCESLGEMKL